MSTVLVTGATGFLGEHLCRSLLDGGHAVRGLARTSSPLLEDLGVTMIRGDVAGGVAQSATPPDSMTRGGDTLARAVDGCAAVFHLAGVVSRDPDDGQRMMRLHVDGTRRVMEAMKAAGVPRLILSSTSGTVAVSKDPQVFDETYDYATDVVGGWPYYASKIYQEKLAFRLGKDLGIEVVAVNPSLLLGPGDRRLSSTGDVRRFLRRQIPTVPKGGLNFVDARDAAAATAAALTRGAAGERYLLGGPNWTVAEFFGRLERVSKVRGPRLKLPSKVSRWGAGLIEEIYRRRGDEPPVDRISVEMSEHYWWFDSGKAARELGFEARDPQLTLGDTVAYLRQGVDGDL